MLPDSKQAYRIHYIKLVDSVPLPQNFDLIDSTFGFFLPVVLGASGWCLAQ